MALTASTLASLHAHANEAAERAHVPFSGEAAAAALLLSDGTWVPGVRVESAAFSLTIPPALNAFSTAVAAGRHDVVAVAFNRPVQRIERAFLDDLPAGPFVPEEKSRGENACALIAKSALAENPGAERVLPALRTRLDPFLSASLPAAPRTGVRLARSVAKRALVPASHFPVGAVLQVDDRLVPGANVEPAAGSAAADWTHVLCAERNALGTACTYGLLDRGSARTRADAPPADTPPRASPSHHEHEALYLSCPNDPAGSPCGACRQLLVELLPRAVLWMDRAVNPPERARPMGLLPGAFRGVALPYSVPDA